MHGSPNRMRACGWLFVFGAADDGAVLQCAWDNQAERRRRSARRCPFTHHSPHRTRWAHSMIRFCLCFTRARAEEPPGCRIAVRRRSFSSIVRGRYKASSRTTVITTAVCAVLENHTPRAPVAHRAQGLRGASEAPRARAHTARDRHLAVSLADRGRTAARTARTPQRGTATATRLAGRVASAFHTQGSTTPSYRMRPWLLQSRHLVPPATTRTFSDHSVMRLQ